MARHRSGPPSTTCPSALPTSAPAEARGGRLARSSLSPDPSPSARTRSTSPGGPCMHPTNEPGGITAVVAVPASPAGRPAAPPAGSWDGRKEMLVASLGEVEDLLELLEATGAREHELEVLGDGLF